MSTLIFFALSMCWVLATPIGGGPDEPAHLIKAAATVRGELVGHSVPHESTALREMTVPESYTRGEFLPHCYQFYATRSAFCAPAWSGGTKASSATTYVGRYPPFYYLIVGLPSLVTPSVGGVYAMRAISALLCSLLVGLAFAVTAAYARSRLMIVGVVVAATPLLVFLSAIVNPSGVEMAAGLCAWAAGLVIVLDHIDAPPRAAVGALIASGSALVLTRSISPLWLVAVLGTLFLLDPRGTFALARRAGPIRKALVALGAVTAFALVYDAATKGYAVAPAGQPVPAGSSTVTIIRLALDRTDRYFHQFIGVFGWLDTNSPALTVVIWTVMLIAVVVIGLIAGSWRQRLCLVLLGVAIIVVPTAITSSHARVDGLVWQARYSYPLDVGVLLLATAAASHGWFTRRGVVRLIAVAAAVGVVLAQGAAYYTALRRFVVGSQGTTHFLFNHAGDWEPPLAPIVLFVALMVALVAYAGWVVVLTTHRLDRDAEAVTAADRR